MWALLVCTNADSGELGGLFFAEDELAVLQFCAFGVFGLLPVFFFMSSLSCLFTNPDNTV